jgi:branched-chain amino acid transport system permease protein
MEYEPVATQTGKPVARAWAAVKSVFQTKAVRVSGYALFGAVLATLPFILGSNYMTRVAITCGIYVMLSLGLNIVVGFCGLLDLGYVAFYAIGAYLYAFMASPHFHTHLPWLAILPFCALVPALFGIALGTPTLRLRGDYLAIVTLGFGEMIRLFINNLDGLTNGPKGIANLDAVTIFGFRFSTPTRYYYLVLFFALLFVVAISRLGRSRMGRAWGAIREDEVAAKSTGLNTHSLKLRAFAMGASFAGVAGLMFAGFQRFVSPESFTFNESVIIFCMITIGGMGSIPGAILGSILLVVLPEVLRPVADYRYLFYGLLLILVMTTRPQGLWPSKQRKRELTERTEQ